MADITRISDRRQSFWFGRESYLVPSRLFIEVARNRSFVLLRVSIDERWRGVRIGSGV